MRRALLAVTLLALLAPMASSPDPAGAEEVTGYPVRPSVARTGDPLPDLRFVGAGWGHGVGMSQYGAYELAKDGRTHREILEHYYRGTSLDTMPDSDEVVVRLFRLWDRNATSSAASDENLRTTPVTAVGGTVRWSICPVAPQEPDPASAGSEPPPCRMVSQTDGVTWTLRAVGSVVELVSAAGTPVFPEDVDGYRSVATTLSPVGEVPIERPTVRLEGPNPNTARGATCAGQARAGTACYGFGRIEVLANSSQLLVTNRLSMGAYLRGIAEMPSSWGGAAGGQAALEAQVITARTFAAGRSTIRATTNDQVFLGLTQEAIASHRNWVDAVQATAGRILRTPSGGLAQTFYSSSNGGRSENVEDSVSYGSTPISYLVSVDDPYSTRSSNPCRAWERRSSQADAAGLFGSAIPQTLSRVERVRILSRTQGGTPRELEVRGVDTSGTVRTFTFTRPNDVGKHIAGGHLRAALPIAAQRPGWTATDGCSKTSRLPSAQIRSIGFAPFHDDDGSAHEYAIVWATTAGVASGRTETTYVPDAGLRRDQMATLLVNTFDIPPSDTHAFTDVEAGSTHAAAINALAAAGVARGKTADRFDPGGTVTRSQMATFLARAAGWDTSGEPAFVDVSETDVHRGAIAAIQREGVTAGCAPDRYCPTQTVTRGQMASFLYRLVRG